MNIETKNKYFAILAMALLMMTILPALSSLEKPIVSAQTTGQTTGSLPQGVTPQVIINPRAFLSFTPTTIGVNQPVLVNTWTTPPPDADRLHENYQITITAPDKTQTVETINSEVADGTAWFTFTPTQTGTYQLQFNFLGTYFPAGRYGFGQYVNGQNGHSLHRLNVLHPKFNWRTKPNSSKRDCQLMARKSNPNRILGQTCSIGQ